MINIILHSDKNHESFQGRSGQYGWNRSGIGHYPILKKREQLKSNLEKSLSLIVKAINGNILQQVDVSFPVMCNFPVKS